MGTWFAFSKEKKELATRTAPRETFRVSCSASYLFSCFGLHSSLAPLTACVCSRWLSNWTTERLYTYPLPGFSALDRKAGLWCRSMVGWFLTLGILSTAAAAPSIVFPVNSQVPPVARVSKAFQFAFAQSTFSSTTSGISYALSDAPGWLQIDSANRSLFGTPEPQDAGPVEFSLVATDDSGSSVMPVTLVVSTNPGPALGQPVADQLARFGAFSSPESLVLPFASSISLSFTPETFTNTDSDTVYYALCANNTPLPSWINFNANSLSFSGTTPQSTSAMELPQVYNIHLTASDVAGFTGAIASFQLVVENHIFAFSPGPIQLNVTPGLLVNYSGLQTSLTMDDHPVQPAQISQVEADAPPWISLDRDNLILVGIPPVDISSTNFTVSATDIYGDQASTVVYIETSGNASYSFFTSQLKPADAKIGSVFWYSLADAISLDPSLQVFIDLSDASWLSFNPSTKILQGNVPGNLKPGQIVLDVSASKGTQVQNETITVNVFQGGDDAQEPTTGSRSTTTSSGSATATRGTHPATASLSTSQGRRKGWIAAAVLLPLLAALAFIALLCWCRRRRKVSRQGYMRPSKEQISRPRPISWIRRTSILPPLNAIQRQRISSHGIVVEKSNNLPPQTQQEDEGGPLLREKKASSKAPKIAFPRLSRPRWSDLGITQDTAAARVHPEQKPAYQLAPEDQERWSQGAKSASSKRRSSKLSGESIVFDNSVLQMFSAKRKRHSFRSATSSSAPFGRYMSGFGHGRNGFNGLSTASSRARGRSVVGLGHGSGGPPGHGTIRDSWRSEWLSTMGSLSSRKFGSEYSQTLPSNMQWPRPPTSTTLNPFSQPQTIREASDDDSVHRPTIRRVFSVTEDPWPARQNYVERRARNRHRDNALFSAKTSSRVASFFNDT